MENIKPGIHPTAIIDPTAEIGTGVSIGAYCVIGRDVKIGDGTEISPNVVIDHSTWLGKNNKVMSGAVLGGDPQDWGFKGEESFVKIGDNNIIREFVTIHRASGEGTETVIGDNCMLMAYCHIGHNCHLGSYITMANSVGVSGHVHIEDKVVFGGISGIHQFVRIGKMSMVGGFARIVQDIPPFSISEGRPAQVRDINVIGLRRNNIGPTTRSALKKAFKLLYMSNLNKTQALEVIEEEVEKGPEVEYLLNFLRTTKEGTSGRALQIPKP